MTTQTCSSSKWGISFISRFSQNLSRAWRPESQRPNTPGERGEYRAEHIEGGVLDRGVVGPLIERVTAGEDGLHHLGVSQGLEAQLEKLLESVSNSLISSVSDNTMDDTGYLKFF